MKACFADNVESPIACSLDLEESYNCMIATKNKYVAGDKTKCPYWQPGRAIRLALDILGVPDGTPCGRCRHDR